MKYATYTNPMDIKPGTRKYCLFKIWEKDSDDEMTVYEANAKSENPVLEKTVAGWLCFWRWWKAHR